MPVNSPTWWFNSSPSADSWAPSTGLGDDTIAAEFVAENLDLRDQDRQLSAWPQDRMQVAY